MIDEFSTFLCFGYYSDDLNIHSKNRIWVICDECGKNRCVQFRAYRDLCKSCCQIGKKNPMYGKKHSHQTIESLRKLNLNKKLSEETKQKISKSSIGKIHTEETKKKMSKSHIGIIFSDEHKLNISKSHIGMLGKRHSEETKLKQSKRVSGKNNPNYNPNITDEERQMKRNYPEYKEWRKLVYERDYYTCQICGDNKGGNLIAHHLEGYNSNKELRTTLGNGITLCEECHGNFHHQYGKGNNTKEQFIEFIGK